MCVHVYISLPKEQNSFVDVVAFTIKKQFVYITNVHIYVAMYMYKGNNHRYISIHCMLLIILCIYLQDIIHK